MDLSIIIPTYNRNSKLKECLQALEHNDAEFIVVDDGSPTPVQVPPNVRLIRHTNNRGRAAAVNSGIRAASHDLILMLDDDIFAAPDMVVRLADEFALWNNPKLALVGRVVWDPDVKLTLTMQWLEEVGPFHDISVNRSGVLSNLATGNTMMWRPFVLEHGGFDEGFTHYGLEDVELGLRLKQHGLEVRLLASAIGYHHKSMLVGDLADRELQEGLSAVYLHSKFPDYLPQVADIDTLNRNLEQAQTAAAAVDELTMLEQSNSARVPSGVPELFMLVYRYHFLKGIMNGLKSMGPIQPPRQSAASLALYNQASHLESMQEFSEARRLFHLVRDRDDENYWAGAEYHLGLIESHRGNIELARTHFRSCIQLNPEHRLASDALKIPSVFREIRANIFEKIETTAKSKILFALFGGLDDVVNAFPVVAGLRDKYHSSEIVWLTVPEYAPLARASYADRIHESTPLGMIPWDWVRSEGFTHVFHPEVRTNLDEFSASNLHPIDFMAQKCAVEIETRKAWLEPGPEALFEAEHFLSEHGLTRKGFLAMAVLDGSKRHWPPANYTRVARALGMPLVLIGATKENPIPGTISCSGESFRMMAALIRWSAFFMGPDSGISWIATTTNTPMGVFRNSASTGIGFKDALRGDKEELQEWDQHTSAEAVLDHIAIHVQGIGFSGSMGIHEKNFNFPGKILL